MLFAKPQLLSKSLLIANLDVYINDLSFDNTDFGDFIFR